MLRVYRRLAGVYRRMPRVYVRLPGVYRRTPRVYRRLPEVYRRTVRVYRRLVGVYRRFDSFYPIIDQKRSQKTSANKLKYNLLRIKTGYLIVNQSLALPGALTRQLI